MPPLRERAIHGSRASAKRRARRGQASARPLSSAGMGAAARRASARRACAGAALAAKPRRDRRSSSSTVSIEAPATLDVAERKRRGEQDARRGGAAHDFADGEERFARERIMRLERRRPAVRHQELAAPIARHRDALGIGERKARSLASGAASEGGRLVVRSREPAPLRARRRRVAGSVPLPAAAIPRARRRASSARSERSRRKAASRPRDRPRRRRARARSSAPRSRSPRAPRPRAPRRPPCARAVAPARDARSRGLHR